MKIIIVGCGKVGRSIAENLLKEKHNIVVIDSNGELVENVSNSLDVLGIVGDGASMSILKEAGIEDADLLLAVTSADEINMLCCLFAKKANQNCKTIARVRNPVYNEEIKYIKEDLGLTMTINPEMITAGEISRLIRWSSDIQVDTFARGRLELISFAVDDNRNLIDRSIKDIMSTYRDPILFVGIQRNEEAIIPNGDTIIRSGDKVCVASTSDVTTAFLNKIGIYQMHIKNCMIVGGSKIAYYLSSILQKNNIDVTIIDKDEKRCEMLAEQLPNASIINGFASEDNLLVEEGLGEADCFVSLTGADEENLILGMYAKKVSKAKVITKVDHINYEGVVNSLDAGVIVSPKKITASNIVSYVRGLKNADGNEIETMHRILGNKAEALSFIIKEKSKVVGVQFEKLHLKKNLLICSIIRGNDIIVPTGKTSMEIGDIVLVVTTNTGLSSIEGIVR